MINRVRQFTIDRAFDRIEIIVSSLGALVGLHFAYRYKTVSRLLLLAPALTYTSIVLKAEMLEQWKSEGRITFYHYGFEESLPLQSVLDWATERGLRRGDNPARWRGHLDKLLPKRSKLQRVQHHPALPYAELPAFMGKLREAEGLAARALELCILTATGSSETLEARWSEIDMEPASGPSPLIA